MLHLKNIEYELVNEPLREWTDWMREHVPDPRVPILRIVDDTGKETILRESNDINIWLDTYVGDVTYTPELDSLDYKQMNVWFDWCADSLKPTIDLYKYGENRMFDKEKHIEHTKQLQELLQVLEDDLKNKKYLLRDSLTLADIAIIPFIRQIMRTRNGEFDLDEYPGVQKWSAQLLDAEWFDSVIMKKRT